MSAELVLLTILGALIVIAALNHLDNDDDDERK